MAGGRVSNVVVAADHVVQVGGVRARGSSAHHAVGTPCLIHHTGVGAGAHNTGARFFASTLIHHFQVWVTSTLGCQQLTLVPVGEAI